MQGGYRNIYKICRQTAGLTQERAAGELDVSVESLRAYETGRTVPPNDVVERMVIRYNAQHLACQHLFETNALYGRIVPQIEDRSLMEIVFRLYNQMRHFEQDHSIDRLMEIAEDNFIDVEEQPEFMAIVAEMREMIKSGLELQAHGTGAHMDCAE